MAKEEIKIELTLDYDPENNDGKPARIFLYQLLNRLNREFPILEVSYNGKKKSFRKEGENISDIALRKVDSVSDSDLPTPPAWLEDKTELPKELKNKN